MGKINVLDFSVANLIAAGEVVDRPASVVKELCENSIDAKATKLVVEVKHGGTTFIRVTDNGNGIEADDMPLTVLRHATSKIATAEDLASIGTLGFRGEALAAISSVSKFKMISRTKDNSLGTVMYCEGGEILEIEETGCSVGTSIIATELFYNVPARRKFLKKDASELAAVTAVMEKLALSSPDVSIKYIADNEVKFMTSGDGDLKGAIYSVYGKNIAQRMTKVDRTSAEGIRITGYISEPDIVRSNKNGETFFINGRFVKSHTAMAALEQAYSTRIPSQKFPTSVLNIILNPANVDVNVHPSKLEVKFANERIVFEAVYYAVLGALTEDAQRPEFNIPTVSAKPKQSYANAFAPVERNKDDKPEKAQIKLSDWSSSTTKSESNIVKETVKDSFKPFDFDKNNAEPVKVSQSSTSENTINKTTEKNTGIEKDISEKTENIVKENKLEEAPVEKNKIPEYTIIGEAYNTYVMVQLEDRILMIDKHAAHERILFDEMCKRMHETKKNSQILMYPAKILIGEEEGIALEEFRDKIMSLGFDFIVKGTELEVSQIPDGIGRESALDMISELASNISESTGSIETTEAKFFEAKLYQASCKAAIKGGRAYGIDHIKWICDRILVVPNGTGPATKTCPHGRPVAFEIKKTSIDRQFDRLK